MTDHCPDCGKFTQARDEMTARLRKEVEAQRLRAKWRAIWNQRPAMALAAE